MISLCNSTLTLFYRLVKVDALKMLRRVMEKQRRALGCFRECGGFVSLVSLIMGLDRAIEVCKLLCSFSLLLFVMFFMRFFQIIFNFSLLLLQSDEAGLEVRQRANTVV